MNATTQKGFTLIELMIVIAIIGILAAIALPAYQTYTKKARFAEVVLAASSVKGAIDTCFQTRGEGDLTNCDTDTEVGADLDGAAAGDQALRRTVHFNQHGRQGRQGRRERGHYRLDYELNGRSSI